MPAFSRLPFIRNRSITKIKDQLWPHKLTIKDIRPFQRGRYAESAVDNFLSMNRSSFDALDITTSIGFDHESINIYLKPNGVIGAVPLISPDTRKTIGGIIVEPKFGWNDIGPLLSSIGWAASPQILELPMIPGSAREIPSWVLAGPIIERLFILLQNLNRGFNLVHETRESPRGKILWQQYFTNSIVHGRFNKFPCVFPDLNQNNQLRAYIKWGLQKTKYSLLSTTEFDATSQNLLAKIDYLLSLLFDVKEEAPFSNSIEQIIHSSPLLSTSFLNGLQALTWIKDEQGLAGNREPDGLAWKMVMSDLFEKWVGAVLGEWAKKFGGIITSSRKDTSRVSIHWENQSLHSISNLIPDFVVETYDAVYIVDAKYKTLYEELDDQKYRELSNMLQEEHRHDLHQILAYASLFNKKRIVSILTYPLTDDTYTKLRNRSKLLNRGTISIQGRSLELGIFGIPLAVNYDYTIKDIAESLDPLMTPLAI